MIELKIENWIEARWLINCAMAAIEEVYEKDSVRYKEMVKLTNDLHEQVKSQMKNPDDYNT